MKVSLPVFQCTRLAARLSIAQCVATYELAKRPANHAERLRTSRCVECPVGGAHARGEKVARWPDGEPVAREEILVEKPPPGGLPRKRREPAAMPPVVAVASPPRLRAPTTTPPLPTLRTPEEPMAAKTITHAGTTQTYKQWADALGVSSVAITARINRGWTEQEAVSTPQGDVPARLVRERAKQAAPPPAKTKSSRPAPKPAPKAARPRPTKTVETEVRSALTAIAPVELLARLGYVIEDLGEHPRGQLFVVVKAAS